MPDLFSFWPHVSLVTSCKIWMQHTSLLAAGWATHCAGNGVRNLHNLPKGEARHTWRHSMRVFAVLFAYKGSCTFYFLRQWRTWSQFSTLRAEGCVIWGAPMRTNNHFALATADSNDVFCVGIKVSISIDCIEMEIFIPTQNLLAVHDLSRPT